MSCGRVKAFFKLKFELKTNYHACQLACTAGARFSSSGQKGSVMQHFRVVGEDVIVATNLW